MGIMKITADAMNIKIHTKPWAGCFCTHFKNVCEKSGRRMRFSGAVNMESYTIRNKSVNMALETTFFPSSFCKNFIGSRLLEHSDNEDDNDVDNDDEEGTAVAFPDSGAGDCDCD